MADVLLLTLIVIPFLISPVHELTELSICFLGIAAFCLLVFKIWYNVAKVRRIKKCIQQTESQDPRNTGKDSFLDIGITLTHDKLAVDIFSGIEILHSIKRMDFLNGSTEQTIVILESQWENWNYVQSISKADTYYQVILDTGVKLNNVIRLREGYFKYMEDPINSQTVADFANQLAWTLGVKIKDCRPHSLPEQSGT